MTLLKRIALAEAAQRRRDARERTAVLLVVVPALVIAIAGAIVSVMVWMR